MSGEANQAVHRAGCDGLDQQRVGLVRDRFRAAGKSTHLLRVRMFRFMVLLPAAVGLGMLLLEEFAYALGPLLSVLSLPEDPATRPSHFVPNQEIWTEALLIVSATALAAALAAPLLYRRRKMGQLRSDLASLSTDERLEALRSVEGDALGDTRKLVRPLLTELRAAHREVTPACPPDGASLEVVAEK